MGVALSVPLGNRGARGSYGQATAARDRVGLRVKQLPNISVEVENAVGTARKAISAGVTATREAPGCGSRLRRGGQETGERKEHGFNVLSLQNDLTTARSQEIRASADYNKALAELYFSGGQFSINGVLRWKK